MEQDFHRIFTWRKTTPKNLKCKGKLDVESVVSMQNGANSYIIKEGQESFVFKIGLPKPEDYGISALASWNTTIWVTEKTDKGFTLRFGTPCPSKGGLLYLTLYAPNKPIIWQQTRTVGRTDQEKIKYSKKTRDAMARI